VKYPPINIYLLDGMKVVGIVSSGSGHHFRLAPAETKEAAVII